MARRHPQEFATPPTYAPLLTGKMILAVPMGFWGQFVFGKLLWVDFDNRQMYIEPEDQPGLVRKSFDGWVIIRPGEDFKRWRESWGHDED